MRGLNAGTACCAAAVAAFATGCGSSEPNLLSGLGSPAELAPANTELYAEVSLDPGTEATEALSGLGTSLDSDLENAIDDVTGLLGAGPIDFETDLEPLLGDRAAVSVTDLQPTSFLPGAATAPAAAPPDSGESTAVLTQAPTPVPGSTVTASAVGIFTLNDSEAATKLLDQAGAEIDASRSEIGGAELINFGPVAAAVTAGHLLVGDPAGVRAALEPGRPKLADVSVFQSALDRVTADGAEPVAFFATTNLRQVSLVDLTREPDALSPRNARRIVDDLNFRLDQPLTLALYAEPDRVFADYSVALRDRIDAEPAARLLAGLPAESTAALADPILEVLVAQPLASGFEAGIEIEGERAGFTPEEIERRVEARLGIELGSLRQVEAIGGYARPAGVDGTTAGAAIVTHRSVAAAGDVFETLRLIIAESGLSPYPVDIRGVPRAYHVLPGPGLSFPLWLGVAGRRVAFASTEDSLVRALDAGAGSRLQDGNEIDEARRALAGGFVPSGFAELTEIVGPEEVESLGRLQRVSVGSRQERDGLLTTRIALELADAPLEAPQVPSAQGAEKGAYAAWFQFLGQSPPS